VSEREREREREREIVRISKVSGLLYKYSFNRNMQSDRLRQLG
jgi:hypothetical protein